MPTPLSIADLTSIEATHRGFLYQHLYLVGCMLVGFPRGLQTAISEHDEDVELIQEGRHVYIQVKTRATAPLQPSELDNVRRRFMGLADEHRQSLRVGTPQFILVTNVAPSEKLIREVSSSLWPEGTKISHPGAPYLPDMNLPPAWQDLDEAFTWCIEHASGLPTTALEPATIVLKLAGFAWFLSSGRAGSPRHHLNASDFASIVEQIERSFHELPPPPVSYLPHQNEPPALSPQSVRLIVGMSGAGKTAWLANAAMCFLGPIVYVNAPAMIATRLGEEVVRESCRALDLDREETRLVLRPRRSDLFEFEHRSGLLLGEPPSDLPPAPVGVLVPQVRSTAQFGERADPETPEAFT